MDAYHAFGFSPSRLRPERGRLGRDAAERIQAPRTFEIMQGSLPFFNGPWMVYFDRRSVLTCLDLDSGERRWKKQYRVSAQGREENEKSLVVAIADRSVFSFSYPLLTKTDLSSGRERWQVECPYCFSPWDVLVMDGSIVLYAVDEDIEGLLIRFDLETGELSLNSKPGLVYPHVFLGSLEAGAFYISHSGGSRNQAKLYAFDAVSLRKLHKWDFTSAADFGKKALWDGKSILWRDRLIASSDEKKLLALDVATGDKAWEYPLRQQFSRTYSLDAQDDAVYLVDDHHYVKLDPATGAVVGERDMEAAWAKAGCRYPGGNLSVNGELALVLSQQSDLFLFQIDTGEVLWTGNLDVGTDRFGGPVLLDSMLVNTDVFEGLVQVFPIGNG